FLSAVREMYPDLPRILLTGYADKENAIKAINEVSLFQYLEKPWDNEQLKLVLKNAIESKSLREHLHMKIKELDEVLRHRDELFEHNNMIARELKLARKLQQALLPRKLPQIDGVKFETYCKPAIEIGGDFYDIIPMQDGCWSVLVADATGHGIQAALSTALLKFAFVSFAGGNHQPSQILSGMNEILEKGLPEELYVAALVARIDPGKREITISNGGLTYPYLIRKQENKSELVASNGMMLGFIRPEMYKPGPDKAVMLDPGNSLILYTDGLTEAVNKDGDFFESKNLPEVLKKLGSSACGEIINGLAESLGDFNGGVYSDDVTLFGIEINTDRR
ncbi:MAG TPA: response regulator, partial [candidate division Zixibacteria bacterium]|nr:response regulator [candidate division Zixibacteria bacterium]